MKQERNLDVKLLVDTSGITTLALVPVYMVFIIFPLCTESNAFLELMKHNTAVRLFLSPYSMILSKARILSSAFSLSQVGFDLSELPCCKRPVIDVEIHQDSRYLLLGPLVPRMSLK